MLVLKSNFSVSLEEISPELVKVFSIVWVLTVVSDICVVVLLPSSEYFLASIAFPAKIPPTNTIIIKGYIG